MPEKEHKTIGFFTNGVPFDGSSIKEGALGGSESALVQAAKALADRGHRVMVFNNCPRPGKHDNVWYYDKTDYARVSSQTRFDVFIVSRYFGFFSVPIPAALTVLWNHDTLEEVAPLKKVLDKIDIQFTLSEYHRNNYLSKLPGYADRIIKTRNGIDLALIDSIRHGLKKDPNKLIYASRPERGLEQLLEDIWPKLKAWNPELKLYICGYDPINLDIPAHMLESYKHINHLIDTSRDVTQLGALPKKDYYRHLASSAMMLYPCSFPEISCINALEAQAIETPILTTNGFALTETVKIDEFKVDGRPGTESYTNEYVSRAIKLLSNPELLAEHAQKARSIVEKEYSWSNIAEEWDRIFNIFSKARANKDGRTQIFSKAGADNDALTKNIEPASTRLKKDNLKILFIHGEHFLLHEIMNTLPRLGHEVRLIMIEEKELKLQDLITTLSSEIKDFQPDMVLTINHLGFDKEGAITHLFDRLGLPFASWYVDSPLLILEHYKENLSDFGSIYLWDSDYIEDIKALGFDRVYYLPLATDETIFRPSNGQRNPLANMKCSLSFVGNSMTGPISRKLAQFNFSDSDFPWIDSLANAFITSKDKSPRRILSGINTGCHSLQSLTAADMVDLEALITWRATQIYRARNINALSRLHPTIVGDDGWGEQLDPSQFNLMSPLNYYEQLPWFYPISKVNFNVTSLQMKTGLNQRVFDVPACGAFLLSDCRQQLADMFDIGKEAIWFESPEEAADLASFYMKNSSARKSVAEKAYKRVMSQHTYSHRLSAMISQMRKDYQ